MAKTATINAATAKKIIAGFEEFEELKKQVLLLIPEKFIPYGSKLWWQKEVLGGEDEIRKGKVKEYRNAKSLISDLHKGI